MRKVLGLAGLLALLLVAGCGAEPAEQARAFDGTRAYNDVQAQVALGPRLPASDASREARAYITRELQQAGWAVTEEGWGYNGIELANVVARRGQGPLVIVGAHYDCRAQADRDTQASNEPVPGANDGASGVAVLLELGRTLDASSLQHEVWLAFFDAEDQGGLNGWPWSVGARQMAQTLPRRPEFVVIVDMVGDAEQELYWERSSTPWLNSQIWSLAADLGYGTHFVPEPKHSIIDDHTPFLDLGIPAVDVIDFDYPYWHTAADTADKVSPASLERVGRVVQQLLEGTGLD